MTPVNDTLDEAGMVSGEIPERTVASSPRTKHPSCPSPYDPKQCAYAMARLVEQIIKMGFVHPERKDELLDRAYNLEAGHGFKLTSELWSDPGYSFTVDPCPRRRSRPTPNPEAEELLS